MSSAIVFSFVGEVLSERSELVDRRAGKKNVSGAADGMDDAEVAESLNKKKATEAERAQVTSEN